MDMETINYHRRNMGLPQHEIDPRNGKPASANQARHPNKNLRGRKRQTNQPYEVWYNAVSGEIFQVLKCYQAPANEAKNQHAIRLVAYSGPMEVDEAGHDMYLSDLRRRGTLVWSEDSSNTGVKPAPMPAQYAIHR